MYCLHSSTTQPDVHDDSDCSSRKSVPKHQWTSQEETELKTLFPRTFEEGKLPGQREMKLKFKTSEVFKDSKFTFSAIKNKLIRMMEPK